MYVDLVVVVVAPWGPGEGGRSQHCKSRGPQSLPWKGSWCLAHLPPPGSILTSTLEPGQEFQDHLEEFPEIVKLAVDVSAHRHRRIYSLHVALLNCKIIFLTKYQVFFLQKHTKNFPCFSTQDLDVTFFDHFAFSQLFNLLVKVTCVSHPSQKHSLSEIKPSNNC